MGNVRAPVKLHSTRVSNTARVSSPENPVHFIFLHGFLSHGGSLMSLARRLHECLATERMAASVEAIVVDSRNHGRSPHTSTHTLEDMVADLREWLHWHGYVVAGKRAEGNLMTPRIIAVGHSMGTLTWAKYLLDHRHGDVHRAPVAGFVSLDMPPLTKSLFPSSLRNLLHEYIDYMRRVRLSAITDMRSAHEEFNRCGIRDRRLQGFLTTNLQIIRKSGGAPPDVSWRCNLPVLDENLRNGSIFLTDADARVCARGEIDVPILSILGAESEVGRHKRLQGLWKGCSIATTEEHILPKAGHNVFYDDLSGTTSLIAGFARRLETLQTS
ncbi:Alpha/beta hydrolase family, putative [Trypanosoma equiperdum]|nr:Alpha/beta hydrolase family, putative [Trypanosoma equiperdum]